MKPFRLILRSVACFAVLSAVMLVALPVHARAQDVSNLYMVGIAYNPSASPSIAGTGLYAHRLSDAGTYSISFIDALPNPTKPTSVSTNVGTGIAQKIATIGTVPVYGLTSGGIAYTGTATSWQATAGFGAPIQFKPNWYVMPTFRVLKSPVSNADVQFIAGISVGFGK